MTALTALSALIGQANRPQQANSKNAGYLMGDVEDGYGDIEDAYGDVLTSPLDTYNTLIGDVDDEEIGAPRTKVGRFISKNKKSLIIGGAALAGGGLAYAAAKSIARRKRVRAAEAQNAAANTIQNQVLARQLLSKIPRNAQFPFYQITGATLNQYPLKPTDHFVANDLRVAMDLQAMQTPFESEIVSGIYAAGTFTCTATGTAAGRIYTGVLVTAGINQLAGNPGMIFTITATFPLVNGGSLVISTAPWSFTMGADLYAKFLVFPWQLITNQPYFAMGTYSNAANIVVAVSGLPSTATVNMIVPGSAHPWTIGMRNAMV